MDMYTGWAELYDLVYESQEKNRDIPFLLELLGECRGPVLECACGTGRVLIPIAERGFEVFGIDSNEHMLGILREKVSGLPEETRKRIAFTKADIRDFRLGRKFNACLIAFNSLFHLQTDSDVRRFFRSVNRNMEKGGTFIIDVFEFNPDHPHGNFVLQTRLKDRRRTISKYAKTEFRGNQINDCEFKIVVDGGGKERVIRRKFKLHYLLHDQLWKLLNAEGFDVVKVYGNYGSEPYDTNIRNEKMIFVSKKI